KARAVGIDADQLDVLEQREVGDRSVAELDVDALVATAADLENAIADLLVDGAQAEVAQPFDVARLELQVDDLLDRRERKRRLGRHAANAVAAEADDRSDRAGE